MFTTYILFSPALNKYYIGQTGNLSQRMALHKAGSTAQTARSEDWMLVFAEHVATRSEATRLERAIKRKRSHASIRRYIADPRNTVQTALPQTSG